jgi:hypothetical protein
MTGQMSQSQDAEAQRHWGHHNPWGHWGFGAHRKKEPSVDSAATSFFTGIGFIVASVAILLYAPAGDLWWWAFLIAAFPMMGQGVGEYLRWKEHQRKLTSPIKSEPYPVVQQSPAQAATLSAPTTSELVKPSSVTEHTTRHLE